MSEQSPIDPIARAKFLVERGLALYGKGDVPGAVLHWLAARHADPQNRRANEYLNFVKLNDGIDPDQLPPEPERLHLEPDPIGPARPRTVPEYIPNPPEGATAEPVERRPEPPPQPGAPPEQADPEIAKLLRDLRECARHDDFSGMFDLSERILQREPRHAEARAAHERATENLIRMFESKLGSLKAVPVVKIPADEVIWLNLNHREGFVLSQVDGLMCYEDILDVCGMPRLEALRILVSLHSDGVIGPAS